MHNVTRQFILAGNSTFTIEEPNGTHHTYRVQVAEPTTRFPQTAWFVDFLSGSDNETSYTKLGKLSDFTGQVNTYARTAQYAGSKKLKLLNRVLARVWAGDHQAFEQHGYKLHHEGRCGRCGRKLTTPESCERGIGPECWEMMGGEKLAPVTKVEPNPLPVVPAPAKVATPVRQTKFNVPSDPDAYRDPAQDDTQLPHPVNLKTRESAVSVFASDLHLKAGQWPDALVQDGVTFTRGNEVRDREGELTLIQYVGPDCRVLTVFND